MNSSVRSIVLGCSLLAAMGCGSSTPGVVSKDRLAKMAGGAIKDTVSVTGRVLVDGTPAEGVNIYLYSDPPLLVIRQTRTGKDGTYCWSTNVHCDGLEPGTYKLGFRHILEERDNDNSMEQDDLFKSRYSDAMKNTFKLTVAANTPQKDVDYELKSK